MEWNVPGAGLEIARQLGRKGGRKRQMTVSRLHLNPGF
jgi:hypothetical protein